MALFSYTAILYSDLDKESYAHANELVNKHHVTILRSYNNGCRAMIHADGNFLVTIGFLKIGKSKYSCQCIAYSYDCVCEHIVAAALAYDRSRGAI